MHRTVTTPTGYKMDEAPDTLDGTGLAGGKTPAYVAYSTFKTLLDDLKTNSIPPQIDRSVLKRFSGGVQGQLIPALKYLNLITAESRPTTRLQRLVEAYGTDTYPSVLRSVLDDAYPYIRAIDLRTATPTMFADAFKDNSGAKEDVLRKCRSFYLAAAKEAGVEMGPRLLNATQTRAPSNGNKGARRAVRTPTPKGERHNMPPPPNPPAGETGTAKQLEYQLIDLLKDGTIGNAESEAIWTLVRFLATKKKATDH